MTVMLLQLSLLVVTVIQLTSSQPTYDVTQQHIDVSSCGRTQQVLRQLTMAVSQLQSQLQSGMSQLQEDVKACTGNKETNVTAKGTLRNHNNQSHRQAASVAC